MCAQQGWYWGCQLLSVKAWRHLNHGCLVTPAPVVHLSTMCVRQGWYWGCQLLSVKAGLSSAAWTLTVGARSSGF